MRDPRPGRKQHAGRVDARQEVIVELEVTMKEGERGVIHFARSRASRLRMRRTSIHRVIDGV